MNDDWKQNLPEDVVVLDLETVSGSETHPTASNKNNNNSDIVISLEEYKRSIPENEKSAFREYQISCFPELFKIRNCEDDKESEEPVLQLSEAGKILSSLIEAKLKTETDESNNNIPQN